MKKILLIQHKLLLTFVFIIIVSGVVLVFGQQLKLNSGAYLHNRGATILVNGKLLNEGTISNTGIEGFTVYGDWINSGSFAAGAISHKIGGNLTNNGVFAAEGSTIICFGTLFQTIDGLSATTFHNLTINNSDGVQLNSNALITVAGLLIIQDSSVFEIAPVSKLTVTGSFTNMAGITGLIIQSSATVTGSLIHHTEGVSATVQRYMTKDKWHIVSPSAMGQNIMGFTTNGANNIPQSGVNYGMMYYSELGGGWKYVTTSTTGELAIANGYLLRHTTDNTLSIQGTLKATSTDVAITRDAHGWNSIGNPFPCSIGIRVDATTAENFLTYNANQFDPSYAVLYFWDEPTIKIPGVSYYKVVGNSGFVSDLPALNQSYIPSGQGFVVKAKTGGGIVSFTNAMRLHESTTSFLKSTDNSWSGFNLTMTSEGKSANTAIAFHPNMTRGLDITYDAGLLGGNPAFNIYSRLVDDNGVKFMLQCLPYNGLDTTTIPVGIDFTSGGIVSFSAEITSLPIGSKVFLEDKLLNTFTDLETAAYTTAISPNTSGIGRFYLNTYNYGTETKINELQVVHIYSFRKEIFVKGTLSGNANANLIDITGRRIKTYQLYPSDLTILSAKDVPSGLYILKIVGKSFRIEKKMMIE